MKANILIIDDEIDILNPVEKALRYFSHEVFTAEDGQEALSILGNRKIDILLTDLRMPNMDGLTLLEHVQNDYPAIRSIVVTGHGDEEAAIDALKLGAVNFIKKPIDLDHLKQAIEKELDVLTLIDEKEKTTLNMIETSRLASIGEMATGIAHELNQPLQTFSFALHSLKKKIDTDKYDKIVFKDKIEKMERLSEYMGSVINNLRGYARGSVELSIFSIQEALDSTLAIIGTALKKQGVEISTKGLDEIAVKSDLTKMIQVFINLIGNARDAYLSLENFTKPYPIHISFSEKKGKKLILIRDEAGGIPEDLRAKVFDPFISTKDAVKGTGLGLHIVRQILGKQKMDISIKVKENVGTTMVIDLGSDADR